MTPAFFLFVIISEYSFLCCPNGYTFCASESTTCNEVGIIAYGSDAPGTGVSYTYQQTSQPVLCSNNLFGDPAANEPKQCCYQDPILSGPSGISPIVRTISCGEVIAGWMKDQSTPHYYKLTTNSIHDITYNLCSVPFDATLTVYNSNGNAISLGVCAGSASRPNYGDGCDPNGYCGNSNKEAFTLWNQLAGTYYIRIAYYTTLSTWHYDDIYHIQLDCDGNTLYPTTNTPTTSMPTTFAPTTLEPTTYDPTTSEPTTSTPTTTVPTTVIPTKTPSDAPISIPSNVPTKTPTERPTAHSSLSSEGEVETSSAKDTASGNNDSNKLNSNSTGISMIIVGIIIGILILIICAGLMFIWCRKMKTNDDHKNLSGTKKALELTENNNIAAHHIQSVSTFNDGIISSNNNDDDSVLVNDTVHQSHNDGEFEENDLDVLNRVNHITVGGNENDYDDDDVLQEINHVTVGNNNENNYINTPEANENEFIIEDNDDTNGRYDAEGDVNNI